MKEFIDKVIEWIKDNQMVVIGGVVGLIFVITTVIIGVSISNAAKPKEIAEPVVAEVQTQTETRQAETVKAVEFKKAAIDAIVDETSIVVILKDKDGNSIKDVEWKLTLVKDDEKKEYSDEDKDGEIKIEDLVSGKYRIEIGDIAGYEKIESTEVELEEFVVDEAILEQVVIQDESNSYEDTMSDSGSRNQAAAESVPEQPVVIPEPTQPQTQPQTKPQGPMKVLVKENDLVVYDVNSVREVDIPKDSMILQENNRGEIILALPEGNVAVSAFLTERETIQLGTGAVSLPTKAFVLKPAEEEVKSEETQSQEQEQTQEQTQTESSMDRYFEYEIVARTEEKEMVIVDGWNDIGGDRYYYSNGKPLTGGQFIDGLNYYFDSNGALISTHVIDVSTYNGDIDWRAVKASGIDYAIIRVGYRGWWYGKIVEDARFAKNAAEARAAGVEIGVYFVTQAVNTEEAVEEASFAVTMARRYGATLPIVIDVEGAGDGIDPGRQDIISVEMRTAVINAFAKTVASSGYTPMVYSSKSWFMYLINADSIYPYCQVWVAQYYYGLDETTYGGRYNMWQFSSTTRVPGISGDVDMSIWIR